MRTEKISLIIFDMDGTIFTSSIDWAYVKRKLNVINTTILEKLYSNHTVDHKGMRFLEEIERENTLSAEPVPGAIEFIRSVSGSGIKTSLITNNNQNNTDFLLRKYGLGFDSVITRENRMWKPSPEAFTLSMKKFNTSPDRTISIGDSMFDVEASLQAGISRIYIINNGENRAGEHGNVRYFDDYFHLSGLLNNTPEN